MAGRATRLLLVVGVVAWVTAAAADAGKPWLALHAASDSDADPFGPTGLGTVRLWLVADAAATERAGGEARMHQHLDNVFARLRSLYEVPTTEDGEGALAFVPPLQLRLARTTVNATVGGRDTPPTDASEVLYGLATWAGATAAGEYDVVYLMTGADLLLGGRDILGMAYLGSACSNAGAGVAELRATAEDDALLAAHEVGHTLGAQHDQGPTDGVCAAGAYIMSPTAQPRAVWSSCSVAQVNAFLASSYGRPAFCNTDRLDPPPPPASVAGRATSPWPPPVWLGAAVAAGLGAAALGHL